MTAIILDTETTGLTEPRPVEIAWLRLGAPTDAHIYEEFVQRYNPGKPIEYGAMATHHITAEDVADCPLWTEFKLPGDTEYLIGHNVDYDWQVIGSPDVKRICTLALARAIWAGLDSHRLGALIYFLRPAFAREELTMRSHSALMDAEHCWDVLWAIRSNLASLASWEALWEASEVARVPTAMPYGKHKGLEIAKVPADYKRWLLGQPDVDPYLRKALTR